MIWGAELWCAAWMMAARMNEIAANHDYGAMLAAEEQCFAALDALRDVTAASREAAEYLPIRRGADTERDRASAAIALAEAALANESECRGCVAKEAAMLRAGRERDAARAERDRLAAVLRADCARNCTPAYTERGMHAPECRVDEVGDA